MQDLVQLINVAKDTDIQRQTGPAEHMRLYALSSFEDRLASQKFGQDTTHGPDVDCRPLDDQEQ